MKGGTCGGCCKALLYTWVFEERDYRKPELSWRQCGLLGSGSLGSGLPSPTKLMAHCSWLLHLLGSQLPWRIKLWLLDQGVPFHTHTHTHMGHPARMPALIYIKKSERQYSLLVSKHPPGLGPSLVLSITSLLGHVMSSTLCQVVLPIIGSPEPK